MAVENNQNWPSWLPIRSELADLKPYGAPQISGVRALNTNENPYDLPEKVVAEMLDALPQVLTNRGPSEIHKQKRGQRVQLS
jgi:histidinol-phosphate/aromatic aminotransferase/cobyric acid decarboxylase-like protein